MDDVIPSLTFPSQASFFFVLVEARPPPKVAVMQKNLTKQVTRTFQQSLCLRTKS
jgi:hypothetical protein